MCAFHEGVRTHGSSRRGSRGGSRASLWRARAVVTLFGFFSFTQLLHTRGSLSSRGERLRRFTRVRTRLCSREVHEVGAVVTLLGFFSLTNWGLTSQSVSRYFSFVSFH